MPKPYTVSVLAPDYIGTGNVGEDIYLDHAWALTVDAASKLAKQRAAQAHGKPEAWKDFALLHVFPGHIHEAFDHD